MISGVIVESIEEAKKLVVLGFCEVEGKNIPPLACLMFFVSFCKYGITPPAGYREWKREQRDYRFKHKVKIGKNVKQQDWDARHGIYLKSICL